MRISKEILKTIDRAASIEAKEKRDFFWLCSQPSLSKFLLPDQHFALFDTIDLNQVLHDLNRIVWNPLNEKSPQRLGHYAEYLFRMGFDLAFEGQILAHNIQLIEGGKTKGEIDFLIQHQQLFIHLEFALKFYIRIDGQFEPELIGPNAHDSWLEKKEKLLKSQSVATRSYRNFLPEHLRKINWKEQVLILGRIFNYCDLESEIMENWAIKIKNSPFLKKDTPFFAIVSNSREWILPVSKNVELIDYQTLVLNLKDLKRPILVIRYDAMRSLHSWGFVLPNEWPDLRKSAR